LISWNIDHDNGQEISDTSKLVDNAYVKVTQLFNQTLQRYAGHSDFFMRKRRQARSKPLVNPEFSTPTNASTTNPNTTTTTPQSQTPQQPQLHAQSQSQQQRPSTLTPTATTTTSFSNTIAAAGNSVDTFDGRVHAILKSLQRARSYDSPTIQEHDLVIAVTELLSQHATLPVGKLGSLIHNKLNNHALPQMLKETYGGLKRFLQRHSNLFTIGTDHEFNPSVQLAAAVTPTSTANLDQQQHLFPFNVNASAYAQPFFNQTFTQIPQQQLPTHQNIYHQQQAQSQALHAQQIHMPIQYTQQTIFPNIIPQAYFMQQQPHPYDASAAMNQAPSTQYSNHNRS
jgi:hypothetical protein